MGEETLGYVHRHVVQPMPSSCCCGLQAECLQVKQEQEDSTKLEAAEPIENAIEAVSTEAR